MTTAAHGHGQPELDWKHLEEFDKALKSWSERALKASAAALKKAGGHVATETKASFGSGSGPKMNSGALAGSITTTEPVQTSHGYSAQVGPAGLAYGRRVELGKRGKFSAAPHPYFRPGYDRAAHKFVEIFAKEWRESAPKG